VDSVVEPSVCGDTTSLKKVLSGCQKLILLPDDDPRITDICKRYAPCLRARARHLCARRPPLT
jgi:hypothetical protein